MSDIQEMLQDLLLEAAHVGFVVPDLEAAIAEASALYGLRDTDVEYQPARGEDAPTRFAFFTVAGLCFEYVEPCSEYFRELLFAAPSGGGGINHIAWKVSDIARALAILAEKGVTPGYVTPEGIVRIGNKLMVYLDPATTGGHLVELIEELPQS